MNDYMGLRLTLWDEEGEEFLLLPLHLKFISTVHYLETRARKGHTRTRHVGVLYQGRFYRSYWRPLRVS
jgi:hypothetical protein